MRKALAVKGHRGLKPLNLVTSTGRRGFILWPALAHHTNGRRQLFTVCRQATEPVPTSLRGGCIYLTIRTATSSLPGRTFSEAAR